MDLVSAYNRTRSCVLAEQTERTSSAWERMRGLLGREGLPHGHALLIAPCNSIHMFFMRFAIDALFLDKDGRVVKAIPRLAPWRATRVYLAARSVLELAAGTLEETGTQLGDVIEFPTRGLTATSETG
jgi:uncharacterized protein